MSRVLVTGASGFLGRELLTRLLERGDAVIVLTRGAEAERTLSDRTRVHSARVRYLHCDLATMGGELRVDDLRDVDECWHVAAQTSFHAIKAEIFATNVHGTRRLIAWLAEAAPAAHFHHVSTAYVADARADESLEDVLPPRVTFASDYEHSKHEAERVVRDGPLRFTIYRPSIVVAQDPITRALGVPESLKLYLEALGVAVARAREQRADRSEDSRLRVLAHPALTKNFVGVHDTVACCLDIAASRRDQRTFHVVNPRPVRLRALFEALELALGLDRLEPCPSIDDPSSAEKLAQRLTARYSRYLLDPEPNWSVTNLRAAVPAFAPATAGLADMVRALNTHYRASTAAAAVLRAK